MKIAILTFQWANNKNFGASLQSFACKNLMDKAIGEKTTKIINFEPEKTKKLKNKILNLFLAKNFRDYNNKFLALTEDINDFSDLKKLNDSFDTFVVGSDQVWRGIWLLPTKTNYFFDFVNDDKKKIAYAASFGVDNWEGSEELTNKIKPLIKRFDHISVREKSGVDICKDTFDVDSTWVLDPTLMLRKEDYEEILKDYTDKSHLNSKYSAYMLLDDSKVLRDFGNKISKALDSKMIFVKGKEIKILGKTLTFFNRVSQWLTYLRDSEIVITDSFHCTVFSLIFHKNFIVIANKHRGMARLESLLSMVGLEERFIKDIDEPNVMDIISKEIDYEDVERRIDIERKKSFEFLKNALGVK